MTESSLLSVFLLTISTLVAVQCQANWCPCHEPGKEVAQLLSKDQISTTECQKMKGFFFSEEREYKCECCLLLKKTKESCKPAKNTKVIVKCADGLQCDSKYICKAQESQSSHSLVMIVKHPESSQISQSFGRSFAQMLRGMLSCDCSYTRCDNEVTRMQCEAQQGLFVDKLSVRNRCQCCDRCYVPRGHYQKCANSQVKNVQYVCDNNLYCSPFTHMCIEKREVFSQFLMKVEKENRFKELGLFEEEQPSQEQSTFLIRKKRDDEESEPDAKLQAPAPEEGEEPDKPLQKGKPDKHKKDKKDKKHKEESEEEHEKEEKEHEGGEGEEEEHTTTTHKPKGKDKKGKKGDKEEHKEKGKDKKKDKKGR